MQKSLVITTINDENHLGIKRLVEESQKQGYRLLIIGDSLTPNHASKPNMDFISLKEQQDSEFHVGKLLPVGHYARKNFGYLILAKMGNEWICETDDDNVIYEEFWENQTSDFYIENSYPTKWINIYKFFGHENIWHRGIPINEVELANCAVVSNVKTEQEIVCVQGLANGDPDVDAICRILFKPDVTFETNNSFLLESSNYCPTNSQMTKWKTSKTLPILYLPSTVSWRVSDIWRGLIAQRYFSICGYTSQFRGGLGFQKRNEHNLLKNFIDEFEVHKNSGKLISLIEGVTSNDPYIFMEQIYDILKNNELVQPEELIILKAWLKDCRQISKTISSRLQP